MEEKELDQILSKFWFEVRTQEGEHYKVSSLKNLHYGINRVLHNKGHEFDIVHGSSFKQSRKDFTDACAELKALGFGYRVPYKEIKPKGMYKNIK